MVHVGECFTVQWGHLPTWGVRTSPSRRQPAGFMKTGAGASLAKRGAFLKGLELPLGGKRIQSGAGGRGGRSVRGHFPSWGPTTQNSDFQERDCGGPALTHPVPNSCTRSTSEQQPSLHMGWFPGRKDQGAPGILQVDCWWWRGHRGRTFVPGGKER